MMHFSTRVTDLPNAGIAFMMRYAAKYPDAVSLGQGTPLFPTPAFIYDGVRSEARTSPLVGMYADTKPEIESTLKGHIIAAIQKEYGFTTTPDRLAITVGGAGALFASILSLLEPGDEVIFLNPSYPLHLTQIHLAQATPVFVPYRTDGWKIDLDRLKQAITKKTRVIILTNPNNPTGTVLSETEVRILADIIRSTGCMLIVDEAYGFLTYGTPLFSPLLIPSIREQIILCKSFSKEFALTGWRIGYVHTHPELIEKIRAVQIAFSVCPPTISMVAASIALSDPRGKEATEQFIRTFTETRSAICQRLDRLSKLFSYSRPDGAYYVFPKYHGFDISALEFAKMLVDEAHVITIPGSGMGSLGNGHVRMSFAADSSLIHAAFDRIDEFAKAHHLL